MKVEKIYAITNVVTNYAQGTYEFRLVSAVITKETPKFYWIKNSGFEFDYANRIEKEYANLSPDDAIQAYRMRLSQTIETSRLRLVDSEKELDVFDSTTFIEE